jgi:hypothetical protein
VGRLALAPDAWLFSRPNILEFYPLTADITYTKGSTSPAIWPECACGGGRGGGGGVPGIPPSKVISVGHTIEAPCTSVDPVSWLTAVDVGPTLRAVAECCFACLFQETNLDVGRYRACRGPMGPATTETAPCPDLPPVSSGFRTPASLGQIMLGL